LQKHENVQAKSNKHYSTPTAEQMKKQFITNLCQWDAYGRGFSKSIVAIHIPLLVSGSKVGDYPSVSAIQFQFLDVTCFIEENVLSHMYVLPHIQCIYIAKSIFAD